MIRPLEARTVCLYLSLLLMTASATFGQTGTTSVRGVVVDASAAVVGGARITLLNTAQGLQRTTHSNSSGEYEFLALPPGTYTLTAEKEGFKKYEQTHLQLLVNIASSVTVKLQVGSVNSQIEVSAAGETINTTDASLGNAFDENQVKQLPLESRNVGNLLSLQAGVLYTGDYTDVNTLVDTRNGAVNGARSDQSNITVDGIPANQKGAYAFQSVLPVTLDSVQEFRVTTTNYGADEGTSSAAQVALVTKSGTNSFHGSVYEYNRNSFVSANDYFIKSSQLASGDPNSPPFLNRNIFGASLGGAIIKNRLFFFLNYEGYRDAEDISAVRTVPTAAMRDGVIQYLCLTTTSPPCTGNSVLGISGASYTAPAGDMAVAPATITNWDSTSLAPQPGPDAAVLQYMSQYPLPNDQTTGDLLNTAGFRFRDPTTTHKNWYIAKLDYNITSDGKHRLSLTGALANENTDYGTNYAPFLPGTPPQVNLITFNKGLIAGYTAVLSPTLINNFRYGFVRQSLGMNGNSDQPWNYLQAFSQGITYSSAFQRPINNFLEPRQAHLAVRLSVRVPPRF
jgi:hypothetical protein